MERVEKTVFISYRRTNVPWALAIFQNLTHHGFDVFFDYNGIASGDFERVILGNIAARAHFLVLLTPSALERCVEPSDLLRREIETALDARRNIVPLMIEGFDFGTPAIANQLAGRLAALKQYNALGIPPEYFPAAMDRLRDRYLNVPLVAVLHPATIPARKAATAQKTAAEHAPAVVKEELMAQQFFEWAGTTKDLDEQLRLYCEAIRLKPVFPEALLNRGNVRLLKGDAQGALQDYDQSIRLNSLYGYQNRGNVRLLTGDAAGALSDFDEEIRRRPDNVNAFRMRAKISRDMGDFNGAMRALDEAIRIKPDFSSALFDRGNLWREAGDVDSAMRDYDSAIVLEPDLVSAYINRGYSLMGIAGDLIDEAGRATVDKRYFSNKLSDFILDVDWSNGGTFAGLGGEGGAKKALEILRNARRKGTLRVISNG